MNIIDAIKSGKRFKRKESGVYLSIDYHGQIEKKGQPGYHFETDMFSFVENLLADDWEIEEDKYELTRSELMEAVGYSLRKGRIHISDRELDEYLLSVRDKLGMDK